MLYRSDYRFLDKQISYFKHSLFQLVSDFGPNYQARFIISFDEIKAFTERERLTNTTLRDYEDYLIDSGFDVDQGRDRLVLTTSARLIVPAGNESIELSKALRVFRERAALNGDIDNI